MSLRTSPQTGVAISKIFRLVRLSGRFPRQCEHWLGMTGKVGEGGRTFGSVSSKEIAAAAKEQLGLDIDKKKIQLKDAIKTLGTHGVPVKLHAKVIAELKVVVTEG